MGWHTHHAIVVTSWKREAVEAAHAKATELRLIVTPPTDEGMNGYSSFAVVPDGSKEGWDMSDMHNERRAALVEWMGTGAHVYDDGSSPLDWVLVEFPGDGDEAEALDGHGKDRCEGDD